MPKKPVAAPAKKPVPVQQKKDAIVKAQPTSLAKINFAEDEGGFAGMSADDLTIPRISLLQSGSPQVDKTKKSEGKLIAGAEAGDFCDTVENSVVAKSEDGFLLIPVIGRKTYIEWIPKNNGGGFVADHGPDDIILQEAEKDEDTGKYYNKKGNEIVLTYEYHCCILDKNQSNPRHAVISLAGTQVAKAKRMNTVIQNLIRKTEEGRSFNPAPFYSYFHVTSAPQQNKKGQTWMGWNIVRVGDTVELENGAQLYDDCRMFRNAIQKGDVKVAEYQAVEVDTVDDDKSL
jgi:hypothetical protein